MRKGLAWLAGALGVAALARLLRERRRADAAAPPVAPAADDPAEELRAAIAETQVADASEPVEGEQPAATPATSLDERRRRVHERAQEAIDAMSEPPPGA